jgi:NNP family nitrate/nitrite transporter-like MFS transporter
MVGVSAKGFRRAGHAPSLVAALVHFDVSFMCWVLLGELGAHVAEDLGLTPAQKGLVVAVPPLGGAAFRLVLGPLADRVGIKRLGQTTLALTAVPLLWAATAGTTLVEVLGIGLLLGVAGASFAVALPLTSRWYPPEHQGLALGIAGAGNSGTVVAALAAPRVAEHLGWHGTFAVALAPVAVAWLVFSVLAKEPPRTTGGPPTGNVLHLLREQDPRWLCGFYLVTFGGFGGLAGYLPVFLVDRFDLAKVSAGGYAALCAVGGSLLRPFGGRRPTAAAPRRSSSPCSPRSAPSPPRSRPSRRWARRSPSSPRCSPCSGWATAPCSSSSGSACRSASAP